jgi:hypothetical protein
MNMITVNGCKLTSSGVALKKEKAAVAMTAHMQKLAEQTLELLGPSGGEPKPPGLKK